MTVIEPPLSISLTKKKQETMNKEQQDRLWKELSEETKQEYREKYKFHLADSKREMKCSDGGYDLTVLRSHTIVDELVNMFGTHNLNPEPQIKTWEDVEKEGYKIFDDYRGEDISNCDYLELGNYCDCICLQGYNYDLERENPDNKIILKAIATLKIAKLIDLGYGGMVSEEEWKDGNVEKWSVIYMPFKKQPEIMANSHRKEFISFHSKELAEEFMSYESNRKLVEQYYMM